MNSIHHSNFRFFNSLLFSKRVFKEAPKSGPGGGGSGSEEVAAKDPIDLSEDAKGSAVRRMENALGAIPPASPSSEAPRKKLSAQEIRDKAALTRFGKKYEKLNSRQQAFVRAGLRTSFEGVFSENEEENNQAVERRVSQFSDAFKALNEAQRTSFIIEMYKQRAHPVLQAMEVAKMVYGETNKEDVKRRDSKWGWWVRIAKESLSKDLPKIVEYEQKGVIKQDPSLTEDGIGGNMFIRALLAQHEQLGGDAAKVGNVKQALGYKGVRGRTEEAPEEDQAPSGFSIFGSQAE